MNELQLYGKTFPVTLMKGLVAGLQEVGGIATIQVCCLAVLEQQLDDRKEISRLIEPLANYCFFQEDPQDLGYFYTSLFIDGLRICYNRRGSLGLGKALTRHWCSSSNRYSLQLRYGEGLEAFLTQLIEDGLAQKHEKQKLAILALRYLFECFKQDSGIECQMRIKANCLLIKIDVCPFCLNGANYCPIFPALFNSFLEWVQGTNLKTFPIFLQINEQKSRLHCTYIDIVEPHS